MKCGKNFMPVSILFALAVACAGCGGEVSAIKNIVQKNIELTESPKETRSNILRVIHQGTSVQNAKKIMEQAGFKCEMQNDKPFSAGKQYYEHLNYLYCDKERGMVVSRRWQVAIVRQGNNVSDVLVSTGLIGP